jgi:GTPase Era involved in 16S rRNA processing
MATWTETWEERAEGKAFVRIVIQTDRESHKRMIIGKGIGAPSAK